ncbi:MAG: hypothetical protein O2816_13505, partial [Planctomycetota bacterium]|nr:hypothetical protein [Planctomycetota bacterium]
CSGYMAALELAEALLSRAPSDALALVVGAEAMTRVLDAADRATLPIFGDGAGALVVSRSFEDGPGVSPCARMTRPAGGPNIRIEPKRACEGPLLRLTAEGGRVVVTEEPGTRLVVRMRGRAVFRDMLRALPAFVRGALAERGQALEEFARVALHQANARLVEAVATGLELPPERLLQNIARVGNTTGASLPLLLDGAARRGLLRAGDDVLLVGFGAGYSAAITSLRWS